MTHCQSVLPEVGATPSRAFRPAGFSLLELVVALLVVSILLAVAVPSYQRYVLRMHRADAVRALLTMASCQERRRAEAGYYDTTACLPGEENARYEFRFEPHDTPQVSEYTVAAVPRSGTESDPCGNLTLDQSGLRGISGEPSLTRSCWSGR